MNNKCKVLNDQTILLGNHIAADGEAKWDVVKKSGPVLYSNKAIFIMTILKNLKLIMLWNLPNISNQLCLKVQGIC